MVGEALLLLVDVELLDIIDEFLLQSVLVVIGAGHLLQTLYDAFTYLAYALFFKGLYLS